MREEEKFILNGLTWFSRYSEQAAVNPLAVWTHLAARTKCQANIIIPLIVSTNYRPRWQMQSHSYKMRVLHLDYQRITFTGQDAALCWRTNLQLNELGSKSSAAFNSIAYYTPMHVNCRFFKQLYILIVLIWCSLSNRCLWWCRSNELPRAHKGLAWHTLCDTIGSV